MRAREFADIEEFRTGQGSIAILVAGRDTGEVDGDIEFRCVKVARVVGYPGFKLAEAAVEGLALKGAAEAQRAAFFDLIIGGKRMASEMTLVSRTITRSSPAWRGFCPD